MKRLYLIIAFVIPLLGLTCNATDIEQGAQSGDASAQYLLACNYILTQPSDYEAALNWLRLSSKQSYEPATSLLKKLTSNGKERWGNFDLYSFFVYHDIDEDKIEQTTLYASRGHSIASLLVARYYIYEQPDYASAIFYLKKALSDFKSIPGKDDSKGFDAYINEMSPIIDLNDDEFLSDGLNTIVISEICGLLGYCYENGFGVQRDLSTAIDYYIMCDLTNDVCSMIYSSRKHQLNIRTILEEIGNKELSDIILSGLAFYDGWMPNPTPLRMFSKPYSLLIKSKDYDLVDAIDRSAYHGNDEYNANQHGNPLYDSSVSFSSAMGVCAALWHAERYYRGLGVEKDLNKAFRQFFDLVNNTDAAWEEGITQSYPDVYADACYRLYECYANGYGTDADLKLSDQYFRQALIYGSSSALEDDQNRYLNRSLR